jgi:hypothetical protein
MVDPPTPSIEIAQIQAADTSGYSSINFHAALLGWQGFSIGSQDDESIYCNPGGHLQNNLFLYLGKYDMDTDP